MSHLLEGLSWTQDAGASGRRESPGWLGPDPSLGAWSILYCRGAQSLARPLAGRSPDPLGTDPRRVRQTERRTDANQKNKSRLRHAIRALRRAITEKKVKTVEGNDIPMRADCICVHSDTPGAVAVAKAVKEAIRAYLN